MNEQKNLSLNEKGKEEESDEDYQIIKEDYHSSPRCGIKVKIVKRVIKNISFSPLEISPNPYFKYCVTQIKEEEKNDDLKISKRDISNNRDISIINEENKDEKENEESNYMQIVEKKSSEITVNMAFKCNEINEKKEKENLKNNNRKEIKNILHHSLKSSKEDFYKNNHKSNQTNIYNFFNNIVIQENSRSNKFISNKNYQSDENDNKDINIEKKMLNFHSINIKKDKADEKKIIPKKIHLNSDKNEFISFTINNIKKLKKSKKFLIENKAKKKRAKINRQSSFIQKGVNEKEKIHIDEKDNINKKKSRHSLISKDEDKKENRNIFINILKNNEYKNKIKKTKSKQKKTKSLEEKEDVIKFETYKKLENECGTPKRRINCKYKLKMDDSFKESESNNKKNLPKSSKGKRRVSFFESNINNENKKRKSIFNEEKNLNLFRKKKSIFCKDKEKEKFLNNIKEKKIKSQKSKRNKTKEKDDKNKKMKNQHSNANQLLKKIKRRDKSFTIVSQTNQNLIKDECINNNNNNINNNKSFNSSKSKLDNKPELNKNNNSKNDLNRSDIRRKSTQNVLRDNERKERITDLTNKQKIDNMNEYTRQCLQLIPDLYELEDKMPRCKTKINPNFSKDKKIALFDLDETIVHCIGEINMNNIESLSLQSDARVKVCLPGGKREVTIGINIRPHWEEALSKIKKKYHIVAFTASHESYADSVLNYLDPDKKYFEYRLYRSHCVLCVLSEMKFYIKDLKILEDNYDLKDVVIIDNSVLSFAYHLDNGIPISPFYNSKDDTELLDIADFLVKYADENDIRDKLKEVYTLNQFLEILKYYTSEDKQSLDISENEEEEEKENGKTQKKDILSKNKTNVNLNHVDTNNKNINNEDNKKNAIISNKNASTINLTLKDISNMFKDNKNKEEKEKSKYIPKLNDDAILKKQMTRNYEERNKFRYIKREKQKTLRFDINFKKEWYEKQKELKNK